MAHRSRTVLAVWTAGLLVAALSSTAWGQTYSYIGGTGNWSDANNWDVTAVPDAQDADAEFALTDGVFRVVTVDGNYTVGSVRFEGNVQYNLTGPGTLIFDNSSGTALLSQNINSTTYVSEVWQLNSDLDISVGSSSDDRLQLAPTAVTGTGHVVTLTTTSASFYGRRIRWAAASTADLSGISVIEVASGTGMNITTANALGSSGNETTVDVLDGGYLYAGHANALNGDVTIEAGGTLSIGVAGLTGTGTITLANGSAVRLTNASGLSGSQLGTSDIHSGVAAVRYATTLDGSLVEQIDPAVAILSDNAATMTIPVGGITLSGHHIGQYQNPYGAKTAVVGAAGRPIHVDANGAMFTGSGTGSFPTQTLRLDSNVVQLGGTIQIGSNDTLLGYAQKGTIIFNSADNQVTNLHMVAGTLSVPSGVSLNNSGAVHTQIAQTGGTTTIANAQTDLGIELSAGTLNLNVAGAITDGNLVYTAGTLNLVAGALTGTTTVTLDTGTALTWNNYQSHTGGTIIEAGTTVYTAVSGSDPYSALGSEVTLRGTLRPQAGGTEYFHPDIIGDGGLLIAYANGTSNRLIFDGNFVVNPGTTSVEPANIGGQWNYATFAGEISGTGTLSFHELWNVFLDANLAHDNSNFTGQMEIVRGHPTAPFNLWLHADTENALGTGTVVVNNSSGRLYLNAAQDADITVQNGTLYTVAGSITGSLTQTGGTTNLVAGAVQDGDFSFGGGTCNFVAGTFVGASSLTVTGGTMTLTGPQPYNGATSVTGGVLDVRDPNAIGTGDSVYASTGGILRLRWTNANPEFLSPVRGKTITLDTGGIVDTYNDTTAITRDWEADVVVLGNASIRPQGGNYEVSRFGTLTIHDGATLTRDGVAYNSLRFDGVSLPDANGGTILDNGQHGIGIAIDGPITGAGKLTLYAGSVSARGVYLYAPSETFSAGIDLMGGHLYAYAPNSLGTGDVYLAPGTILYGTWPTTASDPNYTSPFGQATITMDEGSKIYVDQNQNNNWAADLVVVGNAEIDTTNGAAHDKQNDFGHLTIGAYTLTRAGNRWGGVGFTGATLTDANGATLFDDQSYYSDTGFKFYGSVDGPGKLIVNLTNAADYRGVWLMGTGTYSGGTEVLDGKLYAQAPSALGTGDVYIHGGATLFADWGYADANASANPLGPITVRLAAGANLSLDGGGNTWYDSRDYSSTDVVVEGNVSVSPGYTGSGWYQSVYLGHLTIGASTVTNSAPRGGNLHFASATLTDPNGTTIYDPIQNNYGNGEFFDGLVDGPGKLIVKLTHPDDKRGVYLNGPGTYTGGTDVQDGQLYAAGPNSLGTGAVHVAAGATLYIQNAQHVADVTNGGAISIASGCGLVQTGAWEGEAGGYAQAVTVPTGTTLDVASIQAQGITVNAGGLLVLRGASITVSESNSMISLAGSAALDVMGNELRVRNVATSGDIAQLDTWVATGVIYSSNPDALKGLGTAYKTAGADANTYIIKDTWKGDATLDGSVTGADLAALATNWNLTSGATWTMGDFNGDGAVTGADLAALATNWNKSLAPAGGGAVPEPATVALLGLGAIALLRRKRR